MQRLKTFIRDSKSTYKRMANGIAAISFVALIAFGSAGTTYWLMHQSFEDDKAEMRKDHSEELARLAYAYGRTVNQEVLPEVREAVTIANEAATKADKALSRAPARIPNVVNAVPEKLTQAERDRINQRVQEANKQLGEKK